MVFGVKRFHKYVFGRHFILANDHKPLLSLFNKKNSITSMASPRIQRWALTLAIYEYTFKYVPGNTIPHVDALSRLTKGTSEVKTYVPQEIVFAIDFLNMTPITASEIKVEIGMDVILREVRECVWKGSIRECMRSGEWSKKRDELSLHDGVLFWRHRVVIPKALCGRMTKMLHEGHPGIVRMKSLARKYVWCMPGIDDQIERMVKECHACQLNVKSENAVQISPWEYPSEPWYRIHIDYAGPFFNKMFLVLVDAHSKWLEVIPMSKCTSGDTIKELGKIFTTHGYPTILVSDNGANFTSSEFSSYTQSCGIKHLLTAPYHPNSNGLAERAVQTFKAAMLTQKDSDSPLDLQTYLFQYRITPHSTTGKSPSVLLMKREIRSKLDCVFPIEKSEREEERENNNNAKIYKISDTVFVRNFANGNKWLEVIIKMVSGLIMEIRLLDGRVVRRHTDHVRNRTSIPVEIPLPLRTEHILPIVTRKDEVEPNVEVSEPQPETNVSEGDTKPEPVSLRRSTRTTKTPSRYC